MPCQGGRLQTVINQICALQGPFWVWMATLAGAMYAGYGLEW